MHGCIIYIVYCYLEWNVNIFVSNKVRPRGEHRTDDGVNANTGLWTLEWTVDWVATYSFHAILPHPVENLILQHW